MSALHTPTPTHLCMRGADVPSLGTTTKPKPGSSLPNMGQEMPGHSQAWMVVELTTFSSVFSLLVPTLTPVLAALSVFVLLSAA